MAEHLVDIRLYGESLKEAFELYLASTGLKVTDKTVVTLREDSERGICADIQNLVISPVHHAPQPVAQQSVAPPQPPPVLKKLATPAVPPPARVSQRESEDNDEAVPEVQAKPKAAGKIEMIDAASAEPGQLEDTKTLLMDASRFEVGPPPKGEPPRIRGGSMVRETPTDTNKDVDPRFQTKPVEGLQELTVRGKVIASGKMSDLPDHGSLPTDD